MAYAKTDWKARVVENPNRFTKFDETEKSVVLVNDPGPATEPGTPFTPENMNHIEEGICEAHRIIDEDMPILLDSKAPIDSPEFTGTVRVPEKTSAAENDGTLVATEAQVHFESQAREEAYKELLDTINLFTPKNFDKLLESLAKKAPIDSPEFTGMPKVPTPSISQINPATATNIVNVEFLTNFLFPIGSSYIQRFNDFDPYEKGLPGRWEIWTHRADGYRLYKLPLPYDEYKSGIAYAANAFVVNPLNNGWGVYRAPAAITAANNTAFNPAQWALVLDLGEGHIPYRLFAATAVFAVNDMATHYWADDYVPTQADYAVNAAYAAGAFVRVLQDAGWWKIYKAPAAITAANNTAWNPTQWEFVYEARQGYKGNFACLVANTAANPPVLNPAQWKQVGELVPAGEYLPFANYAPNANYAANTCVIWHLPGAGYELWKAKAAITNSAAQLDPVLWEKYEAGDIIERRHLQGWLDDDWGIGHVIEGGDYAGMTVCEVLCLGGGFDGWEGGNRPTFVAGGVQHGRIEDITGSLTNNAVYGTGARGSGVLYQNSNIYGAAQTGQGSGFGGDTLSFMASRVVLTGSDVAGTNASMRKWKRVA